MRKIVLVAASFLLTVLHASSQSLLHYWNFNLFDNEANHLAPSFTTGGAAIAYIQGGTSVNDFANGTGQNFDILNLNARNGDPAGNHLRNNNPIGSALIFSLPTTGYNDVVLKYATRRSGSGAGLQTIWYSTDGINFDSLTSIAPNNGDPTLQTIDFSSFPATDNNPNFKVKITFLLGAGGAVGNNRFDNVTLEGTAAGGDVFNPGDLLFVAYQMNATPNDDRIAFVTFVNIIAGTQINFTDAKYTSNAPAQCPGGFTWTAPAGGVTAGTVVTILNDAGTASVGTITGNTFGLSANGDQVIVYTGANTSPSYATALSSNAWLGANITCSGSNSMLPATLTDGANSINLSTAPGNTAGNTVNAYYAGPQNGTIAQLKALIANPANWIGTASATPAQVWPTWSFLQGPTPVTTIAFGGVSIDVPESNTQLIIPITLTNPSASSVKLTVKGAPFSTAAEGQDFTLSTQTLNFTAGSNTNQSIVVPINNDLLNEQDEYFVVTLDSASGLTINGNKFVTIYIRDNDRQAPVPTKQIELEYIGSYDPSGNSNASSEIVVYDSASKRLFIISALQNKLDIADFSNPASIQPVTSIDMTPYGGITSVAVKNGIVAASAPNANQQLNGLVVFFNTNGVFQKQVTVGALPDMITFTPDGHYVMTANEGQPNDSYTVDPEGSVSMIDITGGIASVDQSDVTTLDFTAFNAQAATLIAAGVRQGNPATTLSQNMEPEYIAFSDDSKIAWVILQESNAFAVVNLETKSVTEIWPLGKKDHSLFGNGFDASDVGTPVHISNWPVKGLYMPDGIASYKVNGTTYIVGANEGDDREYSAFNERLRVNAAAYVLDSATFPNAAVLKQDVNLGRLRVSRASGDTDGDGDFDEIHLIGGRSFSIWNTTTKAVVYDSKDDFEQYISKTPLYDPIFNADHESNARKARSSSKGPEPEGLTLAAINGKTYAFIGLERQGGLMVYDITDPADVKMVDYHNARNLTSFGGDNGPEGVFYISKTQSPDGNYYVIVANEISGTLTVYKINAEKKPVVTITSPGNNSSYPANSTITLSADATDEDGSITKVEFYNAGVKLTEDATAPYSFTGSGVEAGNYVLTAIAYDNNGNSTVSDTVRVTVTACTGYGAINGDGFVNIPGTRVSDLTSHSSYPNNPTVQVLLPLFEYGNDLGKEYGARVRGFICVPQSGNYRFAISSDDQSELWLSTNEDPANKRRIAYLDIPVLPRVWNRYPTQISGSIYLVKGAKYYIEALHKEGNGLDHLSVGWVLPNGLIEAPIPGNRLSPFVEPTQPLTQNFRDAMRTAQENIQGLNGLVIRATPNPSPNHFTLTTGSTSEKPLSIIVTDVLGRVMERKTNVPANGTIQIGGKLTAGVYFVEVIQGGQRQKLKLIRQ